MAKEKAPPVFEEPEFDEKEYIRFERERAKSIIVIFIIGAILGLGSGYLEIIGLWYVSVLIIFVFLLFRGRILEALHIEVPKRASHKILVGGEFILTWLIFWIIFLNPPLHVASGPQISDLQVYQSGQWNDMSAATGNIYQIQQIQINSSLRLYTYYGAGIQNVSITYAQATSPSLISALSGVHYAGNHIYFNVTPQRVGIQEIFHVYSTSTNGILSEYTFQVKFVGAQ